MEAAGYIGRFGCFHKLGIPFGVPVRTVIYGDLRGGRRFFGVSESGEPLAGYLLFFLRRYRDVESKGFNSACFQPKLYV